MEIYITAIWKPKCTMVGVEAKVVLKRNGIRNSNAISVTPGVAGGRLGVRCPVFGQPWFIPGPFQNSDASMGILITFLSQLA